jgi:DNA-binding response OmpR family regulator
VQGADVLLWDGWPTGQLATTTDSSQIPQAMLLDFPRLEDRERAIKLGVSEIVSKPFQLSTLWNAVEAAASRSPAA